MSDAATWNATYPARYRIDEFGLRQRRENCPYTIATLRHGKAWATLKSPGQWPGSDLTRFHLGSIAGPLADWPELISGAALLAKDRGAEVLTFGADPNHFWPGIPKECQEHIGILEACGFERKGQCWDVQRDLVDYVPIHPIPDSIRRCTSDDERAVDEFMGRVFPGRWRHDIAWRFSHNPSAIVALWHDAKVQGFAVCQHQGDPFPAAGATWHLDLGENWAALGPIGVSAEHRGKGWGHGLLAWCLNDMKNRGARQTVIDWTVLLDFYGAHGFVPSRTYIPMVKSLNTGNLTPSP